MKLVKYLLILLFELLIIFVSFGNPIWLYNNMFLILLLFLITFFLKIFNIIDKNESKIIIVVLISGIAIVLGFSILTDAYEFERLASPEFRNYDFMIDFSPSNTRVKVINPEINIDYSKKNGNLTFYLSNDDIKKLGGSTIEVPLTSKIESVIVSEENQKIEEGSNYTKSYHSNNSITIWFDNISPNKNDIKIVVSFYSGLEPNGNFKLRIESEYVISYYSNEVFFLYLDPFECSSQYECIREKFNSKIVNEGGKIIVSYTEDYYENYTPTEDSYKIFIQEFSLNTVNKNYLREFRFKEAFGISFITSGAFGLLIEMGECILLFFNSEYRKIGNRKKPIS